MPFQYQNPCAHMTLSPLSWKSCRLPCWSPKESSASFSMQITGRFSLCVNWKYLIEQKIGGYIPYFWFGVINFSHWNFLSKIWHCLELCHCIWITQLKRFSRRRFSRRRIVLPTKLLSDSVYTGIYPHLQGNFALLPWDPIFQRVYVYFIIQNSRSRTTLQFIHE